MLDAAVIGVVFAQISAVARSDSLSPLGAEASAHAASVMFSDTALLRQVDGCVHLTFRISKRTGFSVSQGALPQLQNCCVAGKIQVYCVQHHKERKSWGD